MFNTNTMVTIHTLKKIHTVDTQKIQKNQSTLLQKYYQTTRKDKTKRRELQKQKTLNKTSIVSPYLYNYFKCKWTKLPN